ncbi:MAG: cobalt ECF transporter T component CbiQ [Lachnospiraceae bacterium]|nr:cobalt ECF transporter T component CbiQ [Lachnospiraceae bacterium]
MSKIHHAIHEIHRLDQLAERDQWANRLHPLVKLFVTITFIAVSVSFSRYDVIGLAVMAVYLWFGFQLSELSFRECLWRVRVILPLVCMVGVPNLFLDRLPVQIGPLTVYTGVLSMLTLMMKGIFAVLASYLLIATTGIEQICYALRRLHVPSVMVTQILLTYRYITLLLEQVRIVTQAYSMRAPYQKGVHYKVWGSLAGQLLLRSIDRANEVYESMSLRGYTGDFLYIREKVSFQLRDLLYLLIWTAFFAAARSMPLILVIGNLVTRLFS